MKLPLVVAIAGFLAVPAVAEELAGVKMPEQVTVDGTVLVLNGLGLREATFLRVDVYVAGLYLEEKSQDADEILGADRTRRLVMQFVRAVSREDQVKHWSEGFEKNAPQDLPPLRERIKTSGAWMTDVASGDTMVVTYVPEKGTTIEIKGKVLGTIPGADFGRAVFALWLGPSPPNNGLKDGLLGRL